MFFEIIIHHSSKIKPKQVMRIINMLKEQLRQSVPLENLLLVCPYFSHLHSRILRIIYIKPELLWLPKN